MSTSAPLVWSKEAPGWHRAFGGEEADAFLDFDVHREGGLWEAHVEVTDDLNDYHDYRAHLGVFTSAKKARAACQEYADADAPTRRRMLQALADALARKHRNVTALIDAPLRTKLARPTGEEPSA